MPRQNSNLTSTMNSTNATASTEELPCPWHARREKSQLIYSFFLTYFAVLAASAHLQHALLKNRSQLAIVTRTALTCLMPSVLWFESLFALGMTVHHYINAGSLSKRYKVPSAEVRRPALTELRFILMCLISTNITGSGAASDQSSVALYDWRPRWNQDETVRFESLATSVYVRIGQALLICLTLLQSTSVFAYSIRRLISDQAESTLADHRCLWMSLTGILVCGQSLAALLLNVTLKIQRRPDKLPQESPQDSEAEKNDHGYDRNSFRSGAPSKPGQRSSSLPPVTTASMPGLEVEVPSSSTSTTQQAPPQPQGQSDSSLLLADDSFEFLVLARQLASGVGVIITFPLSDGLYYLGKAPPYIWCQAGLFTSWPGSCIGMDWCGACLLICHYRFYDVILAASSTSVTSYALRSAAELGWYNSAFHGMYKVIRKMLSKNQWPLALAFTAALHLLEPIWVLGTPMKPRFWQRLRKSMLNSLYADAVVILLHFLIVTIGDVFGSVSDAYMLDGKPWPEDVACPKLWKDPLFLPSV